MSTELFIASQLRVAAEDLEGARILSQTGNRNAIYLCSQAAEKIVKAVLTTEGIHAGREHRLDVLLDDLPDENAMKPLLRSIERLGDSSTTYRYPTISGRVKTPPDHSTFNTYARLVKQALEDAAKHFDVDLASQTKPAGNIKPIRG